MGFMELEMTRKGRLVSCECQRCGVTNYAHEWASWDFNGEREAMMTGAYRCDECGHTVGDDNAYWESPSRNWYAARMSAPGYLDCTAWEFGPNKQTLARDVRVVW